MNKENNEFIFKNKKATLEFLSQVNWYSQLIYKKLFIDLIIKLTPTKIQTVVKVFLINTFPFNFDK